MDNSSTKNTLYIVGIITLVIIAVSCAVWTFKVPTIPLQNVEAKKISVNAEGKTNAKPDIAVVNAGIEIKGKTAKDAQQQNDAQMTKLIEYLKSQDIDEKDIKTSNYSLYPEYFYPENSKPVISGFVLRQNVDVKIRDFKKVGVIVGNLTNKGVNIINNINFEIDKPEKYQSEAREEAIKKAKTEAEKIAQNLEVKLGKVLSYNEGIIAPQPYPIYYKTMAEGSIGGGGAPIESGSQDIRVNVNITFEIK